MNSGTEGRLKARPQRATKSAPAGLHKLGVDALLYVPSQASKEPRPLVVSLHGAGGRAQHGIDILRTEADQYGFALLAPASRRQTWDVIAGGYGPDVMATNAALIEAFDRCAAKPDAVAISGFSDGASYALSLGVANGDLFGRIIAFSPGFMLPPSRHGNPGVFISHGKRDQVLNIDACSRRLVPQLRRSGYSVEYREFDGGHTIPGNIKKSAVEWWLAGV